MQLGFGIRQVGEDAGFAKVGHFEEGFVGGEEDIGVDVGGGVELNIIFEICCGTVGGLG